MSEQANMTTIAACVFGAVSAAAVTAHALRTKSSTRGDRRRAALQRKQLEEMVADWRRELWHSVVPFWLTHAVDEKHGFHTYWTTRGIIGCKAAPCGLAPACSVG